MSKTNNRTVESYNVHIQEYIDGTPHEVSGGDKDWLDGLLADVSKDARILELGSAFGRDAEYLAGLGYAVECTDATSAFVDLLQQKGFDAKVLNLSLTNYHKSLILYWQMPFYYTLIVMKLC